MNWKKKKKKAHFKSKTRLTNSSGQAALEYILVTGLTSVIILGMIYQLNSSFQIWAKSYFGDYLSCLIETGELPSLGTESSEKSKEGCSSEYEAFSLTKGRPLIEGVGIKSGSREGEDGSSEEGKNSSNQHSEKSSSSSRSSTNQATYEGSESGSEGVFASPLNSNQIPTNNSSSKSKKSSKNKQSSKVSDSGIKTLNVGPRHGGREKRVPLSEMDSSFSLSGYGEEEGKEEKKLSPNRIKRKKVEESALSTRQKPIPAIPPKNQNIKAPELESITFQGFIRYLIIGGIVIALFVLIGGQFLQIKESLGG